MRYDDRIKEEARALYLQGLGYKSVSNKIREQYKNSLGYNTVKRWAKKDNWDRTEYWTTVTFILPEEPVRFHWNNWNGESYTFE